MIAMLPKTDSVLPPASFRHFFSIAFNNRKKPGMSRQVIQCEAEGTCYSSGHVHIDTIEIPVCDFLSINQMLDYLRTFGDCTLVWLEQS
jgi:hypothetical protein